MEEKKRPQVLMLWDIWRDEKIDKSYATYYLIDIKSEHSELIFSEKEMKNVD